MRRSSLYKSYSSKEEPEAEAAAPHTLYVRATSSSTAELSWQPSDDRAISWVIYVNDVAIARIPAERHSINISDIEFNKARDIWHSPPR